MKQPHIASYLFHYSQSCGTTFAARGLSRGLARLGYRTTLYCCGPLNSRLEQEMQELPNRTIRRFETRKLSHPFFVPSALIDRLSRNEDKVDLLVIHGNFNPRNVAIAKAARKAGIPYIVSPSTLYHPEVFRKNPVRKAVYGKLFEKPLLNAAAALQVFTESQFQALTNYGVRTPAFVVPNGFDPAEVPDAETLEEYPRSSSGAQPEIIYLGRIDMYTKGLDLLVRALSLGISNRRLPRDLRINCTGPDWGDQAKLERLASELGVRENISFLGRVGDRRRWSVIFGCDMMILTSRHDSYPTTVIEAMAAAKPVLLSEETGISPVVRAHQCGFVVSPSPAAICEGLVDALKRRNEWVEMGRRGRKSAYEHLTWDRVAQTASQHYEHVLSRGNGQ
jgi:glycosyltransferase involved in cell wall biosynthesis